MAKKPKRFGLRLTAGWAEVARKWMFRIHKATYKFVSFVSLGDWMVLKDVNLTFVWKFTIINLKVSIPW